MVGEEGEEGRPKRKFKGETFIVTHLYVHEAAIIVVFLSVHFQLVRLSKGSTVALVGLRLAV